jgi:hypothetical protein
MQANSKRVMTPLNRRIVSGVAIGAHRIDIAATIGSADKPTLQKSLKNALFSVGFDSPLSRIRFQLSPHLWGEGRWRDAAGQAGSLRGPRRVFLCAVAKSMTVKSPQSLRRRHFLVIYIDSPAEGI